MPKAVVVSAMAAAIHPMKLSRISGRMAVMPIANPRVTSQVMKPYFPWRSAIFFGSIS